MDETQLNDLKQFIAATVSQATADMATKDDIAQLRSEMHKGFDDTQSSVADALTNANDSTDDRLSDHDLRLTKLEQQAT